MGNTDQTSAVIQKLMTVIDALPNQAEAGRYKAVLTDMKQKYEDPEFRLAVIGNFSCGKSTFLNALLQRNMLTVDTQPTTAIPTYIRWNKSSITAHLTQLREERRRKRTLWQKILDFFRELFHKLPPIDQYPSEPYIIVRSRSKKEYILLGDSLADFEADMGIVLPNETDRIIDYLTTTNALALKIERISLSFPDRDGFQNFCLIDTPGVNPGDEAFQQHIIQTQSVLRNEADAAIILYPAKDAMSKNLERFMTENAAHLMGNAIVLLTKMDIVPMEQERNKIINRTKKLVVQRYQQLEPVVHGISAHEALEYCCSGNSNPNSEHWFHHFNTVFFNVFNSMKERRYQIANKRIDRMLVDLMHTIVSEISTNTAQLTAERQIIQECSTEHLEQAFSSIVQTHRQQMNTATPELLREAKSIVSACIRSRKSKMMEIIDSASSSTELDNRLSYLVPLQMADADQAILDDISKAVLPRYAQINREFTQNAADCLKDHRRYFGEIISRDCACPKEAFTSAVSAFPYKKGLSDEVWTILKILAVVLTAGMYLVIMLIQWIVDLFTYDGKQKAAKTDLCKRIQNYEQKLLDDTERALTVMEQENYTWAADLLIQYQAEHLALFDETEKALQVREETLTEVIQKNQSCLQKLTALRQEYY